MHCRQPHARDADFTSLSPHPRLSTTSRQWNRSESTVAAPSSHMPRSWHRCGGWIVDHCFFFLAVRAFPVSRLQFTKATIPQPPSAPPIKVGTCCTLVIKNPFVLKWWLIQLEFCEYRSWSRLWNFGRWRSSTQHRFPTNDNKIRMPCCARRQGDATERRLQ